MHDAGAWNAKRKQNREEKKQVRTLESLSIVVIVWGIACPLEVIIMSGVDSCWDTCSNLLDTTYQYPGTLPGFTLTEHTLLRDVVGLDRK